MRRVAPGTRFESALPARLDRLPWSAWHRRVVVALGITWMLDGLEVTLVGAIASVLQERDTLALTEAQIGESASAYLAGAVVGALVFGRLTDLLGRKRLFLVTLGVYLAATLASALTWSFTSFAVCRALTGAGIGGEYSAVNSAIDELIPARLRGRVDLAVNATYWLGTALGAGASIVLLDRRVVPHAIGWRLGFGLGATLGAGILLLRRHVPESPRWLLLHGRLEEAGHAVEGIERDVTGAGVALPEPGPEQQLEARGAVTFRWIARVLFARHPRRTVFGLLLMIAQAFAYNGVFFTYALVLGRYFGVPSDRIGYYLLPFAAGNLLGPFTLGPLFDTWGRRPMIAGTYGAGAVLIAFTGYALARGWLDATTQTALWCVVFFVVSTAASSAYLTVSELFPVELRGMAIALFFAVGTGVGGLVAPTFFAHLIQTGSRDEVFFGYAVCAGLMAIAAVGAIFLGVRAEGRSLEELAHVPSP